MINDSNHKGLMNNLAFKLDCPPARTMTCWSFCADLSFFAPVRASSVQAENTRTTPTSSLRASPPSSLRASPPSSSAQAEDPVNERFFSFTLRSGPQCDAQSFGQSLANYSCADNDAESCAKFILPRWRSQ